MGNQLNKYNRYRRLKTISYLLGLPVMILFCLIGSLAFYFSPAFSGTWYNGVAAMAILWVAVTVLQLIFSLLCKSKSGRAMFSLIISLIVVLGAGIAFDLFVGKKAIDDVKGANVKLQEDMTEKYGAEFMKKNGSKYVINVKSYEYQVGQFKNVTKGRTNLTDSYTAMVNRFTSTYNIGVTSSVSGGKNYDGSEYVYNKEKDVYLSNNGLYADGYIFGMKEAINVLLTIYETQDLYKSKGQNVDEVLATELAKLESNKYSEWNTYKNSKEYQDAYGAKGYANKYNLTEAKLDGILAALGTHIGGVLDKLPISLPDDIKALLNSSLTLDRLVQILSVMLDVVPSVDAVTGEAYAFDSSEVKKGTNNDGVALITKLDATWLREIPSTGKMIMLNPSHMVTTYDVDGKPVSKLVYNGETVVTSTDKDANFPVIGAKNTIMNALSGMGLKEFSVDGLMELVKGFMWYQAPNVKSIYSFIADEDLRAYAIAKYNATKHGANVGSVLYGDKIGKITMSSSGNDSSVGFSQNELYTLQAMNSYVPKFYPLFMMRRTIYLFAGLLMVMTAATFHWARKQEEAKGLLLQGGRR